MNPAVIAWLIGTIFGFALMIVSCPQYNTGRRMEILLNVGMIGLIVAEVVVAFTSGLLVAIGLYTLTLASTALAPIFVLPFERFQRSDQKSQGAVT